MSAGSSVFHVQSGPHLEVNSHFPFLCIVVKFWVTCYIRRTEYFFTQRAVEYLGGSLQCIVVEVAVHVVCIIFFVCVIFVNVC